MPPNNGHAHDDDDDEAPTMSLRARLRADIQKVFRVPKVPPGEQAADLEGILAAASKRSREKASFKPPSRVVSGASPAEASSGANGSALPKKKAVACEDQGCQVDFTISEVATEAVLHAHEMGEVPPEPRPLSQMPSRPKLVAREASAAQIRTQVREGREKLGKLDAEVTRLTKQVRVVEKSTWEEQKRLSQSETRIGRLINSCSSAQDEEKLIERECFLRQRVAEARKEAARWSSLAARQDEQLQQELAERRGPAQLSMQETFAKHPAGDIFLPAPSVSDDDESDFDDGPRRPWGARNGGGDAVSSDDDEFLPGWEQSPESAAKSHVLGGGGSGPPPPPPPPRQPWSSTLGDDADEVSDSSSIPSPSEGGSSNHTTPLAGSSNRGTPLARPNGRKAMDDDDSGSAEDV